MKSVLGRASALAAILLICAVQLHHSFLVQLLDLGISALGMGLEIGQLAEKCGVYYRDQCHLAQQVDQLQTHLATIEANFTMLRRQLDHYNHTYRQTLQLADQTELCLDIMALNVVRVYSKQTSLMQLKRRSTVRGMRAGEVPETEDTTETTMERMEYASLGTSIAWFLISDIGIPAGQTIHTYIKRKKIFKKELQPHLQTLQSCSLDLQLDGGGNKKSNTHSKKAKDQRKLSSKEFNEEFLKMMEGFVKLSEDGGVRDAISHLPKDIFVPDMSHADVKKKLTTYGDYFDHAKKLNPSIFDGFDDHTKKIFKQVSHKRISSTKAKTFFKSYLLSAYHPSNAFNEFRSASNVDKLQTVGSLMVGAMELSMTIGMGVYSEKKVRDELLALREKLTEAIADLEQLLPEAQQEVDDLVKVIEGPVQRDFQSMVNALRKATELADDVFPDLSFNETILRESLKGTHLNCSKMPFNLCNKPVNEVFDIVGNTNFTADELEQIQVLVLSVMDAFNDKLRVVHSLQKIIQFVQVQTANNHVFASIREDLEVKCLMREFLFLDEAANHLTYTCPEYKDKDIACMTAYGISQRTGHALNGTYLYRCFDLTPYHMLHPLSTTCPSAPELTQQQVGSKTEGLITGYLYNTKHTLQDVAHFLKLLGIELGQEQLLCAIKLAHPQWTVFDGHQLPDI